MPMPIIDDDVVVLLKHPRENYNPAAPWCCDALFVMTLSGDARGTTIYRGWEAICGAVEAAHYFDPTPEQAEEVASVFLDWDHWDDFDDGYPWRWVREFEDGCITVERVTSPPTWCSSCGCGNDARGYAHLSSCPR